MADQRVLGDREADTAGRVIDEVIVVRCRSMAVFVVAVGRRQAAPGDDRGDGQGHGGDQCAGEMLTVVHDRSLPL